MKNQTFKKSFFSLFIPLVLMQLTNLKAAEVKTVDHVDIPRYMGDWYVISYLPNFVEKDCHSSVESYALRADGEIDNWFVCKKGSFQGPTKKITSRIWVHNKETNAEWRVQFFWPLRLSYLIIDLDPQYQWTVVAHPNRNYLWVMSRRPTLDEGIYQGILKRAHDQGFEVEKLVKVPHEVR